MSTDDFKLPDDVELLKAMIAAREAAHRIALLEREQVITQHDTIEKQLKKLERQYSRSLACFVASTDRRRNASTRIS